MRLLLVEDDQAAADLLVNRFRADGDEVCYARNGVAGLRKALEEPFDVLVVDRMMPELDGLSMVRQLREAGKMVPVLFLSALGEVNDRVEGLTAGGDDYLVKPFAYVELRVRLEALVRRRQPAEETVLVLADLTLDLVRRRVTRAGVEIDLQPRAFSLLEYMLRYQGQIVTRDMLLENVWRFSFDTQTNVIDVHISRLRAKIDKNFEPALLHTLRGKGFVLKVAERVDIES